jgi:Cdc6-like AAA superfamily ATPase
MWESDGGLDLAVGEFIGDLSAGVRALAGKVSGIDVAALEADVTIEAYNLTCAFIDADGLHTDDELWALISTFAKRMDNDLASTSPEMMRKSGLLAGKVRWLDKPSVLLDMVSKADARDGTHLASAYSERATKIGHVVASLDLHPSETELAAIEKFRGLTLRLADGARSAARSAPTPSTAGPEVPPPSADPPARPLPDLLAELDALVGLAGVKEEVKLVANLLQVQAMRKERGLPVLEQSRHLVFTGNPGTGKTTVARLLAQIYRTLGVVERGHLVETDRSQLVAGFVGQTAIQVREVFDKADQGVLLIDEAYALVRGGERDFGREAIDTIVKLVEDRRGSVVVIVAGYPDEMNEFVDANPGLKSRFPKTIFFPDYTTDELLAIFDSLGSKGRYSLDDGARTKLRASLDAQPRDKGFGNGRLVRNLFEAAVARQASRIVGMASPTDEQLCALMAQDIPDAAPDQRAAPSSV